MSQPTNEGSDAKPRTRWHRILAELLRLTFAPLDVTVKTELELMSRSPRADVVLLRREGDDWTSAQRAFLPDGIREVSASHILIEFKYSESVNEHVLMKVLGYRALYQAHQKLADDDLAVFIISSKTPKAKKFLKKYDYDTQNPKGVYRSTNLLLKELPIIALNPLADTPHNAYIKCFASLPREREKAFNQLARIGWNIPEQLWAFIYGLRKTVNVQGGKMIEELIIDEKDVLKVGEQWRQLLLKTMTLEERLIGLKPEERLVGLEPEQVLSRYKPEERLVGLEPEQVLSHYKPEQVLPNYEEHITRQSLHSRIADGLQLRFQLAPEQMASLMSRVEQLEIDPLKVMGGTVFLAEDVTAFEARLIEVETEQPS